MQTTPHIPRADVPPCVEWLVGVDEAGRGPLAGPVAVGVFAFPRTADQSVLCGIRDSKKLTRRGRALWYEELHAQSEVRHAVALVHAPYIDRAGIVRAVYLALSRALSRTGLPPARTLLLLDGGLCAPPAYPQRTIIRGDEQEPVIAAASILAKVTRDRFMERMAAKYPVYGFDRHVGYGTVAHRAALARYGPCELHRRSFGTVPSGAVQFRQVRNHPD